MIRPAALAVLLALACGGPAGAAEPAKGPALPFLSLEPRFDLIDQDGRRRTESDFRGAFALVFFGYANCPGICSVALPTLALALDALDPAVAAELRPLVITVDPERDSPAAMKAALGKLHSSLVGLTGSEAALAAARRTFRVERTLIFTDPAGQPTYAHGGFFYLFDRDGRLLTLLPPVTEPSRLADILRRYIAES